MLPGDYIGKPSNKEKHTIFIGGLSYNLALYCMCSGRLGLGGGGLLLPLQLPHHGAAALR